MNKAKAKRWQKKAEAEAANNPVTEETPEATETEAVDRKQNNRFCILFENAPYRRILPHKIVNFLNIKSSLQIRIIRFKS